MLFVWPSGHVVAGFLGQLRIVWRGHPSIAFLASLGRNLPDRRT